MAALGYGRAWQNYDVTTHGDGSATVRIETADRLNPGDPSEHAEWTMEFDTVEQALQHTGESRITASGVVVTVRIDGREYIG